MFIYLLHVCQASVWNYEFPQNMYQAKIYCCYLISYYRVVALEAHHKHAVHGYASALLSSFNVSLSLAICLSLISPVKCNSLSHKTALVRLVTLHTNCSREVTNSLLNVKMRDCISFGEESGSSIPPRCFFFFYVELK